MQLKDCKSLMCVENFSVWVHLGCTEKEREVPQEVSFTYDIGFREPPPGETTDRLQDTVCYAEICELTENFLENKHYCLVEKMAVDCLGLLRQKYPNVLVRLTLHKIHPPVKNLKGGVKYSCGDFFG